jgi:hypothetical protein
LAQVNPKDGIPEKVMFFFMQNQSKFKHSLLLRGLAVFFAGLYVLSVARGFVPGMCATQSALEKRDNGNYAQAAYTKKGSPCCHTGSHPASKTSEQDAPASETGCVFCVLAKARVEVPERYHFEAPIFAPDFAPAIVPALAHVAVVPTALQDRAPPAT